MSKHTKKRTTRSRGVVAPLERISTTVACTGFASDALRRWEGKVALVTGASSGIGAAIAESLGAMKMKVAICGRDRRRLETVAQRVRDHGGEAFVVVCDQTRIAENARLFRRVRARWKRIDVLVNCAGMRGAVSLLGPEWGELQAALDLNVSATLWCAREAIAQMAEGEEGAVVNISSLVGHRVLPGAPAMYSATKHALRVLTDGLRSEVAQRRLPIKIALISPGLVDTPWHSQPGSVRAGGGNYPHAALAPADIADAVCYVLATKPGVQVSDVLIRSSEQSY